jgi:hypothetical protein
VETPDEFKSIETAQVLNDLNGATRLNDLNDLNNFRVVHPDDRQRKNADDFTTGRKTGNGAAMLSQDQSLILRHH